MTVKSRPSPRQQPAQPPPAEERLLLEAAIARHGTASNHKALADLFVFISRNICRVKETLADADADLLHI